MIYCEFFVPGKPQGKGRPRFSRRGGFVRTYTPERTVSYELSIKAAALVAWQALVLEDEQRKELLGEPCRVSIVARFAVPQSWARARRTGAQKLCPGKPDLDNIAKVVLDAAHDVLWRDDKTVQALAVRKRYAVDGEEEGVQVRVEWREEGEVLRRARRARKGLWLCEEWVG